MSAGADAPARQGVSVVIPVHRCAPFIEACLASVLAQTRPVAQIVLVDDRGGDRSMDLAREFLRAAGADWTEVVHDRNQGLSRARNSGLAAAAGELVWFLDSDDRVDPRFVEILGGALDAGDADFACCRALRVDERGRALGIDEAATADEVITGEQFAHRFVSGRVKAYACTKIYRRSLLGVNPWPEGQAYEDISAMVGIALRSARVAMINEPLYYYLQHSGTITTALNERTLDLFKAGADVRSAVIDGAVIHSAVIDGARRDRWTAELRGFHYREVLTSVAHVAMRADHAAPTRPALYDEVLGRVRRDISGRDVLPLLRDGFRREAVFAVLVKASPALYSAILRHR